MNGAVSEELEVNVPASEAWKLYGTLEFARVLETGPAIEKAQVVQGDGGVGTIIHVVFAPGFTHGFSSFKEKYITVDNEKRVKETEMIEGGYLDLGFSLYRLRIEIIEKSEDWCITRATVEYEAKEAAADNPSSIVGVKQLVQLMEGANTYLINNKNMDD